MKSMKKNTLMPGSMLSKVVGASSIFLIGVAGCNSGTETTEQAGNSAAVDTAQAVDSAVNSVGQAADKAGDAISNAVPNAGNVASNVAEGVANTASQAGQAVENTAQNWDDAAVITPKVKTALGANAALKGTSINVDTGDKKVTLTGTVKNQTQKGVAGTVAKKNAPGYTIVNNLKVAQ